MSQTYRATPPDSTTNILQDNIDQINNDEALRSFFSGTAFPTSPEPVIGQPCYRTDEKVWYIYTADGWVEASNVGAIPNEVKASRGTQANLNSRLSVSLNDDGSLKSPTTANVSEWKDTALTVTRVDSGTFKVNTDQTGLFTTNRQIKANGDSGYEIMYITGSSYNDTTDETTVSVSGVLPDPLNSVDYGLIQYSVPQNYLISEHFSAKGDLLVGTGEKAKTALPVGSDGEVLMAASSKAEGVLWTPLYATADASNVYERGSLPSIKGTSVAADRYTWVSPSGGLVVGISGAVYALASHTELDLSNGSHWDTTSTDYTVASTRAGEDFYVYACEPASGNVPDLVLSASATYPAGYTADTSRKIGGFHCLCADVGAISGHQLSDFVAGDILPLSVWDLQHRPKSAPPEGMVWCADANIWVDIYLQSGTGDTTASAYGATITDTRNWMDHVDDLGAVGKRLLDDGEFQKIAAGGNEETNIAGSADPGTTGGHTDTDGRRIISSIGCEDCAGVMYQWLSDQSYRQVTTVDWDWYDLPGNKGLLYNADGAGGLADVKLRAGGYWADGADCGSRCRYAGSYRWSAHSAGGARGAAEPA